MTTDSIKSLAKKAKLANIGLIGLTLCAFVGFHITNFMNDFWLQEDLLLIYQILSFVFVIISGYLFWQLKDTTFKGGILLLIASVISLIFSLLGMMLGLIIWVLCGVSIRQINNSNQDLDFSSLPKITPIESFDEKNNLFSGFDKNDTESKS